MVDLSWPSVALKWHRFFGLGCVNTFVEYLPIYLKLFGFSASQVGIASLFGVPSLFIPLFGLLGDKFRARRLVFVVLIVVLIFLSLAPLLLLGISNIHDCSPPRSTYSGSQINNLQNQTCCPRKDSSNYSLDLLPSSGNFVTKPAKTLATSKSANVSRSLPTDSQRKQNQTKQSEVLPPSLSILLFIIAIKGVFDMLMGAVTSSWTVAVMTYNKKERANFGAYNCWGNVGTAVSLFFVGVIASRINMTICGAVCHGYFVAFPWAATAMVMSAAGVPWIKYEYLDHRVTNWGEVKGVLSDPHYIIMLFIGTYSGLCYSFQYTWEFWYIAELSGSPMVMAVGGLIRRPLVAIWFRLSVNVIKKLGDLKSLAMGLFIYAVCQLALSLIRNPWLVLVIDIFQSAAHVLAQSSIYIQFSKAGTKASSGVIQGLATQSYNFGVGLGATCTGFMVSSTGTKGTLFYYAIASTIILILHLTYILTSKQVEDYELVPDSESKREADESDG